MRCSGRSRTGACAWRLRWRREKENLALLTVQNDSLLNTTDKLREVLRIAGEGNDDLKVVERKLFNAVDDLALLNRQLNQNNLEQRRRQLRDIFMKFDVDFESKITDQTKLRHMLSYVHSVYDAKMEALDCLGAGGTLAWAEFEEALLKDNFWNAGAGALSFLHTLFCLLLLLILWLTCAR